MLKDKALKGFSSGDIVFVDTGNRSYAGKLIEINSSGVIIHVTEVSIPSLDKYIGTVCFIPNTQITIMVKTNTKDIT
jgi:hypothetical protein